MTRNEFITELEFIFNVAEGTLQPETELHTLKTWDSIGMLNVMTLMKEINASTNVGLLRESKTINDLVKLTANNLK
jgi:acyl carrier protein